MHMLYVNQSATTKALYFALPPSTFLYRQWNRHLRELQTEEQLSV